MLSIKDVSTKRGSYDPQNDKRASLKTLKEEAQILKKNKITLADVSKRNDAIQKLYKNDLETCDELSALVRATYLGQFIPGFCGGSLAKSFKGTLKDSNKISYKATEDTIVDLVNQHKNNKGLLQKSCEKARNAYIDQFKV